MPNFAGCRCCEATYVAAGDNNGWVRMIRNSGTKWYHDIGSTSNLKDVAVLDKHTIVAIDETKAYLVDSTGVIYSASDCPDAPSGGRADWARGLRVRGGKVYAIAAPPYRADASMSVEITYPITFGVAQDMTFIYDCEVDSEGGFYVIGRDVGNSLNPPQFMLRKFDAGASPEWSIVIGDYSASYGSVKSITVDENDNIYIFVTYGTGGYDTFQIECRDSSGGVTWTVSHADASVRCLHYANGILWVRKSSGVFEKFDPSDGSLLDTYTSYVLASSYFKAEPRPNHPFLILTSTSNVAEYDPVVPSLKWQSSNSDGDTVVSLDAKRF